MPDVPDHEMAAREFASVPSSPTTPEPRSTPAAIGNGLRQSIRRRPWLSAVAALFIGCAIATLCGLPREDAWVFLGWSYFALGVAYPCVHYRRVVQWWRHQASSVSPPEETKPAQVESWASSKISFVIALALAGVFRHALWEDHGARDNIQGIAQLQKKAESTQRFWSATVVSLHRFRFELPPESDVPANQYFKRRFDNFLAALRAAKGASTADVDADLVAMVRRHFATDDWEVRSYERLQTLMTERGLPRTKQTVRTAVRGIGAPGEDARQPHR